MVLNVSSREVFRRLGFETSRGMETSCLSLVWKNIVKRLGLDVKHPCWQVKLLVYQIPANEPLDWLAFCRCGPSLNLDLS